MKSRRVLSIVSGLVLLVYTGATAIGATILPTASPSDEASPQAPEVVPADRNPGIFIIGSTNLDRATYANAGDVQYFHWNGTNPARNVFSFGGIDAYIAEHATEGKTVGISLTSTTTRWQTEEGIICAAVGMPQWARVPYTSGSINNATTVILPALPDSNPGDTFRLDLPCEQPIYWSTLYQTYMREWATALANHLKDNPDIAAKVEFIGLPHGVDGETRPVDGQDEPNMNNLTGGFTSQMWVNAVNAITDIWKDAFDNAGLHIPLMLSGAPFYLSASERPGWTDHAVSKGVGLGILGLYTDSNFAVTRNNFSRACPSTTYCGIYDGVYRYWGQVPISWETYQHMLPNNRDFYWGLLHSLHTHSDYVRIRRQFVYEDATGQPVQTNIAIIRQWDDYFGKTVFNAPSVWVAMREHRAPMSYGTQAFETHSAFPVFGNFEYWLYQRDSVPNGQTVIETNTRTITANSVEHEVDLGFCGGPPNLMEGPPGGYPCNTNPYNPNLPSSTVYGSQGGNQFMSNPEAYFARRTDGTSNNYMMWFDVDPLYHQECSSTVGCTVQVTVKWFDIDDDQWRLFYNSTSGPKYAAPDGGSDTWVQKVGTRTMKTTVFTITDARLNGGLTGGMDFAIDSRNPNQVWDGDESVHMVDLKFVAVGSVTPTVTPTITPSPTETPTVTPTPTTTPDTGIVHGVVFNDVNDDNTQNEGEPPVEGAVVAAQLMPGMTEVLTYTTTSSGVYTMTLDPGNYKVLLKEAPSGYVIKDSQSSFFTNVFGGSNFGPWAFPVLAATSTPPPTGTPTITPTATVTPPSQPQSYLPMVRK